MIARVFLLWREGLSVQIDKRNIVNAMHRRCGAQQHACSLNGFYEGKTTQADYVAVMACSCVQHRLYCLAMYDVACLGQSHPINARAQEEIYEDACRPVLSSLFEGTYFTFRMHMLSFRVVSLGTRCSSNTRANLDLPGYNNTVLTYGQNGSGKTYTM